MAEFGITTPYGGASYSGGSGSGKKQRRLMRYQYQQATKYGLPLMDKQMGVQHKWQKLNWEHDREFRQTAAQDMVQGAAAAGIHPLLAMGGGGGMGGSTTAIGAPGVAMPDTRPQQGKSFSLKTISPAEKAAVKESEARSSLLEAQKQEIVFRMNNEILEANARQAGASGNDKGVVEIVPHRVTSPHKDNPAVTAGTPAAMTRVQVTPHKDGTVLIPDQDVLEADSIIGVVLTMWANMDARDRRLTMERLKRQSMSTRSAEYPKPKLKRSKKVPRSSAPYSSRYQSHHYR